MKKSLLLMIALTIGLSAEAAKRSGQKEHYRTKKVLHQKKTNHFKYDYAVLGSSPFTFHDMGMSEAEFFVSNKSPDAIQTEIDRIQGSLTELEYTTKVSYEPKYLNQRPQSQKQKKAFLKGYLKILEEASL